MADHAPPALRAQASLAGGALAVLPPSRGQVQINSRPVSQHPQHSSRAGGAAHSAPGVAAHYPHTTNSRAKSVRRAEQSIVQAAAAEPHIPLPPLGLPIQHVQPAPRCPLNQSSPAARSSLSHPALTCRCRNCRWQCRAPAATGQGGRCRPMGWRRRWCWCGSHRPGAAGCLARQAGTPWQMLSGQKASFPTVRLNLYACRS